MLKYQLIVLLMASCDVSYDKSLFYSTTPEGVSIHSNHCLNVYKVRHSEANPDTVYSKPKWEFKCILSKAHCYLNLIKGLLWCPNIFVYSSVEVSAMLIVVLLVFLYTMDGK